MEPIATEVVRELRFALFRRALRCESGCGHISAEGQPGGMFAADESGRRSPASLHPAVAGAGIGGPSPARWPTIARQAVRGELPFQGRSVGRIHGPPSDGTGQCGARNGHYGISRLAATSFGLDIGGPDHLAPLLGFIDDQLAEVGGRAGKRNAAQIGYSGPWCWDETTTRCRAARLFSYARRARGPVRAYEAVELRR
jgi:hypothetical protein